VDGAGRGAGGRGGGELEEWKRVGGGGDLNRGAGRTGCLLPDTGIL
jgi:hypothetical protein